MSEKIIVENGFEGKNTDHAATIILNNPEAGNIVNGEMLKELTMKIEETSRNKDLKLLVVASRGQDFCSGRDPSGSGNSLEDFKASISSIISLNRAIRSLKCVSMSVIKGRVAGMGAGIALQTDLTVASSDAVISFPEINGGLPPAIVLSYISRFIPRKRAMQMIFTGNPITSDEAFRMSYVNEVVELKDLYATALKWADSICSKDRRAIHACKSYLETSSSMSLQEATDLSLLKMVDWKSNKLD